MTGIGVFRASCKVVFCDGRLAEIAEDGSVPSRVRRIHSLEEVVQGPEGVTPGKARCGW